MTKTLTLALLFLALLFCSAPNASAQTTEFNFQGSLKNNAVAANGNYDFEFALFDSLVAGSQIGATVPGNGVAVTNGIFSVKLDFGSVFPGADRYLEIHVRLTGQPGFITLTPRQLVNTAPYSVKSLSTDNAATAANALQLGGVAANQYVVTTDPRMTDARPPTAGSSDYIQNRATQQALSNFNVSGNGTAGGSLSGGIVNATTQFNISGSRVLGSSAAQSNLFVGFGAGQSNTTSFNNSFFGTVAGGSNTTGEANSFFGSLAGVQNTSGVFNSFFGVEAGSSNTQGSLNSLFGLHAGNLNTTGSGNSFFGNNAGFTNTTGNNNTMLGYDANVALNNLSFATAIGSGSTVSASNTISLGRSAGQDTVQIPGPLNVTGSSTFGGTLGANVVNATTQYNIGGSRVLSNPGTSNLVAGVGAGASLGFMGSNNSFFGASAGSGAPSFVGSNNAMFGFNATVVELPGGNASGNSLFGSSTRGASNSIELTLVGFGATTALFGPFSNATAIGARSQVTASNSLILGSINGVNGATADTNVGIGTTAPAFRLDVAARIRLKQNSGDTGVTNSAGMWLFQNTPNVERAFIGMESDDSVGFYGNNGGGWGLVMNTQTGITSIRALAPVGVTNLCRNGSNEVSFCSSSLKYKTNIAAFSSGLAFVNKLLPISFDWKDGGMKDVGFGAEDVAKIDPRFVTYNTAGEVEGVKYDRIGVVAINAIKEQQSQIEALEKQNLSQQKQIEALTQALCSFKPDLVVCKIKE